MELQLESDSQHSSLFKLNVNFLQSKLKDIAMKLFTDATPNGLKISIALEELGLDYSVQQVYLGGEQFTPEFTQLNPNNKIPVLVDGEQVVTESGAILIYLAEKSGALLPPAGTQRARVIEALMFQMASLGPMFGQYLVFAAAWGNKFPEVSQRYFTEVSRILAVMETRIGESDFLAGDTLSIADIASTPWLRLCRVHPAAEGFNLAAYPKLNAWLDRMLARESVQKGLENPAPFAPEKQFEAFVKATVGLGDLHSQAA